MDENTRRDLLKGTAAIGAVFVATPSLAEEKRFMAVKLEDPTTAYPNDPFPEQKQPWPALQRDMKPVPDSGEASYKGSGRLAGRKALVTGGDSGIGRAAVVGFAREGADVAVNYYPTEEPDAQDLAKLLRAENRNHIDPR